jgi:hypothetical protein
MSTSAIATLFLALVLAAFPASAQETRAAEIAAEQAEKSKVLTPTTNSTAEKVIDWVEDHFNDPNTFYLTFGGIYPTGGFAPGIAARRAVGHARLSAGAAFSVRGYKLLHAAARFPELASDKLEVETRLRWVDATQVPFYGAGNGSIKEDRVNYGLRQIEVGASTAFKPVGWFRVGGGLAMRQMEDRQGKGGFPSIETFGFPSLSPSLFTETRFVQATGLVAIDWRESPGYTRRGGRYSVTAHEFRDNADQFGFRRFDAEVQQFLPILNEHWVLAFRGLVQTTNLVDDQTVPYYLLPTLGGANMHRGYADFRFQDRHVMLLSGEYRWLPSRVLDMALFVDSGKVVAERSDIDFNDLKTAYGIGFRIHGPTFTPFRFDVAHGSEGFRIHLTGGIGF